MKLTLTQIIVMKFAGYNGVVKVTFNSVVSSASQVRGSRGKILTDILGPPTTGTRRMK